VTFPHAPQPGPRPGPPPGGFRPGPPPAAAPVTLPPAPPASVAVTVPPAPHAEGDTGHPAVDAVLRSLANAAQLPPAEQIAAYEAAHQVLRETLASIDG
jgi:hypothetical protein